MALELQISTQQAQANIEAVNTSIRDFATITQQLSRGVTNIENFVAALGSVHPINPEVAASIQAVTQASAGLGAASGNVERFAAALARLGTGASTQAATGIQQVSRAAATVQGTQIDALAAGMGRAGQAASAAVNPMTAAMGAANGFRSELDRVATGMASAGQASITTGAGLDRMAQGMTMSGQAALAAGANIHNLNDATRNAGEGAGNAGQQYSVFGGILQAMAFSYAIEGFRNLVEGAANAATAVLQLKIQVDAATGVAGSGAAAYEHLADRAFQLGIPISSLTGSFGRFVSAMATGGRSLQDSIKIFDNFNVAFRVLGLNSDQVQRSFLAIDQVMQKGKFQSEELVKQLGQTLPGAMELLAKSLGLVNEQGQPAVDQLIKLLKTGQVTAGAMQHFSEVVRDQFAPGLEAASKTGQAALGRLETGFTRVQTAMGDAIWSTITGELNSFAVAMYQAGSPVQALGTALGGIVGGVGTAFLYVVQSWAEVLGTVTQIIGGAAAGIGQMASALYNLLPAGGAVQQTLSAVGQVLGQVISFFGPLGSVVATAAIAWGVFGGAITGTWAAIRAGTGLVFEVLTNPFAQTVLISAAVVAAIAGVAIAAKSLWDTLTKGGTFAENFKANLQSIGDFAGQVRDKLFDIKPAADIASQGLNQTADATGQTAEAFNMARPSTAQYAQQIKELTEAGNTVVTSQTNAGKSADYFAGAAHRGASAAGSLSSGFNGSASAANNATVAYGRAAAAANQYAAAAANASRSSSTMSSNDFGPGNTLDGTSDFAWANSGPSHRSGGNLSVYGGTSPNSTRTAGEVGYPVSTYTPFAGVGLDQAYTDTNGFYHYSATDNGSHMYYGGTSDKGGVGQSFIGAAHYAGGGITPDSASGGIPSILHPNEAVVPLRAGGTIPVSLVGASSPGGSDGTDGQSNPLVTLLTQISADDTTRDSLLGQHNDKLDLILGQLTTAFPQADTYYQNVLNVLNAVLGAINSLGSVSTGGGSSGGSSGGGSFGGVTGQLPPTGVDAAAAAYQSLQSQLAQLEGQRNTAFADSMRDLQATAGSVSINGGGPLANFDYLWQQYYHSQAAQQNASLDAQAQTLIDQYRQTYGDAALKDASQNRGIFSFAVGSPNAAKDTNGGFTATLHPDEAVIPLPDGRTVPVKLQSGIGGNGQSNVNNKTTIVMNITTPDANSFRKSQPQMVADLRGQLQRAQQTSGAVKRATEDPTKRLPKGRSSSTAG